MSFRSRLTFFFVLIVIVPMLSGGVVIFRLISDIDRSKADARIAEGQTAAIGLYNESVNAAREPARRVAQDQRLIAALRAHDAAAATRRAQALLAIVGAKRIVVHEGASTGVDVGARGAV